MVGTEVIAPIVHYLHRECAISFARAGCDRTR